MVRETTDFEGYTAYIDGSRKMTSNVYLERENGKITNIQNESEGIEGTLNLIKTFRVPSEYNAYKGQITEETYTLILSGKEETDTASVSKKIKLNVSNGQIASATIDGVTVEIKGGVISITGLPIGEYILTEENVENKTITIGTEEVGFKWSVTGLGDYAIAVNEVTTAAVENRFKNVNSVNVKLTKLLDWYEEFKRSEAFHVGGKDDFYDFADERFSFKIEGVSISGDTIFESATGNPDGRVTNQVTIETINDHSVRVTGVHAGPTYSLLIRDLVLTGSSADVVISEDDNYKDAGGNNKTLGASDQYFNKGANGSQSSSTDSDGNIIYAYTIENTYRPVSMTIHKYVVDDGKIGESHYINDEFNYKVNYPVVWKTWTPIITGGSSNTRADGRGDNAAYFLLRVPYDKDVKVSNLILREPWNMIQNINELTYYDAELGTNGMDDQAFSNYGKYNTRIESESLNKNGEKITGDSGLSGAYAKADGTAVIKYTNHTNNPWRIEYYVGYGTVLDSEHYTRIESLTSMGYAATGVPIYVPKQDKNELLANYQYYTTTVYGPEGTNPAGTDIKEIGEFTYSYQPVNYEATALYNVSNLVQWAWGQDAAVYTMVANDSVDTPRNVIRIYYQAPVLTVTKTVNGDMGDYNEEFDFTLGAGTWKDGGYSYRLYQTSDGRNWAAVGESNVLIQDSPTFKLKHNQKAEIWLLPNVEYSVTEINGYYETTMEKSPNGSFTDYSTSTTATSAIARFKMTADGMLAVTNTLNAVSPTGYTDRWVPWALCLGAGLLLMLIWSTGWRRRRRDGDGVWRGNCQKRNN